VLVIVVRRPTGRCHSERGKFVNAVNGRTKGEKSEGLLILLTNSSDFDSAIRRFDPSRPSQLILLIKIVFSIASFGKADSAAHRRRRRCVGSPPTTADATDASVHRCKTRVAISGPRESPPAKV
jgi:hypothetical protein